MPTYLSPGVYVEEVPAGSRPIEGVSTSVAAFVGLATKGPFNEPTLVSNWTQFAKIFGDPNEPDNGPFMEGAYLAHSVYGFFQNGGGLCWVVKFIVIAATDGALTGAPDTLTGVFYLAGVGLMAVGLAGLGFSLLSGRNVVLRVLAAVAGLVTWWVTYMLVEGVAQSIVGDTDPVWLGEEIGIVTTGAVLLTLGLLLARPRADRRRPAPAPAV